MEEWVDAYVKHGDQRGDDFIESAPRVASPRGSEARIALGRVSGAEEAERVPAAQ